MEKALRFPSVEGVLRMVLKIKMYERRINKNEPNTTTVQKIKITVSIPLFTVQADGSHVTEEVINFLPSTERQCEYKVGNYQGQGEASHRCKGH